MQEPVEAFRLCPTPGCVVRVWGPTRTVNHCREHGGNQFDFPEIREDTEWGEPDQTLERHLGGPPASSPAVPAIHLGLVED